MVLLEVPEGTVEIPARAYKNRTDITEVRFPASVKSIGPEVFMGCTGVSTLHLNEGLESIGSDAFHDCSGILRVHLPASLRSIGYGAFNCCRRITALRIPRRVQHIGTYAFSSCFGIIDVDLPEGLQSIGAGAFADCTGLKTLVLPSSLTSIIGDDEDYGSFEGCTRLARALAPDALVEGAMAKPAGAFKFCPALLFGLTPLSAVKPRRRRFWHPTMHAWCTASAKACVLAVLLAELRVDGQEDGRLASLPHELWLLILEFAPRRELGPPPAAV